MSENTCPKCGLPLAASSHHICIDKARRRKPPSLSITEDSEICADVDATVKGADGVFRPIMVQQDDGESLSLTIEDAQRLFDFLDEAIPYLEGKVWQLN